MNSKQFKIADYLGTAEIESVTGMTLAQVQLFISNIGSEWVSKNYPGLSVISEHPTYQAWFRNWYMKHSRTMAKLANDTYLLEESFTKCPAIFYRALMYTLLDDSEPIVRRMKADFGAMQPKFFNKKQLSYEQ